jgi:magnesium-transporting ATPase (P-type)
MVTLTIESQRALMYEFMKALCVCHEVVCELSNSQLKFQGPSPDEIALVEAARDVGFELQKTSEHHTEVNFRNGMVGSEE